MKLIGEFCIREIMDEIVAIPTGSGLQEFSGIISLNEVGRFLLEKLQTEQTAESLVEAVLQEYDTTETTAAADVSSFLQVLRDHQLLAE